MSRLVGVLGAGQLGRMVALAGIPLGLRFRFLDPAQSPPAAAVGEHIRGAFDDESALREFAEGTSVITYEFENVPVSSANLLSQVAPVYPPPLALAVGQERGAEKDFFRAHGIATAEYEVVSSGREALAAAARLGGACVLKTTRLGYDGKGQARTAHASEADSAYDSIGGGSVVVERLIPFLRELSVVATRTAAGEIAFYPLVENTHRDGILHTSTAPAVGDESETGRAARALMQRLMAELGYVGTLAVELFDTGSGLLANEMAPRVHNSGHWTIEGCETSQFENHVRAICGLSLGSTAPRGHSRMVNLTGSAAGAEQVLGVSGAHLHLYGKEPRAGRKLGHVTVRADASDQADASLRTVLDLLGLDS